MIFELKHTDYSFLENNSSEAIALTNVMSSSSEVVRFNVDDVSEFQSRINDSVLDVGMDDEDTVNEIGKRLYSIYDEILYQKKNN